MYRGSVVNILLITPEKAIKLVANDYFRHKLTRPDGTLPVTVKNFLVCLFFMPLGRFKTFSFQREMIAGGGAGLLQIAVTTPMELLKIQMQDAGRVAAQLKAAGKSTVHLPTSALSVTKKLMKERGLSGLYKGLGATAMRDVSFSIVYFPLFANLNELGPRRSPNSSEAILWWSFVSGMVAGSFSSVAVCPFDVVKTRLQVVLEKKRVER